MGDYNSFLDGKTGAPPKGAYDEFLDGKAPTPQQEARSKHSGVFNAVSDLVAGGVEGAFGLPDLATGGMNILTKLISPDMAKYQIPSIGRGVTENLMGLAPDRDSTSYETGNIAGGAITGRVPASGLKGLGWGAAKALGSGVVGAKAGDVGQAIGGDTGEAIGEIVGSVAAPMAVKAGTNKLNTNFARKYLGDEFSPGRLKALDELNSTLPDDQKIPITAGLVGNQDARYYENFTGILPFVGAKTHNTQMDQLKGLTAARDQTAGRILNANPTDAPQGHVFSYTSTNSDGLTDFRTAQNPFDDSAFGQVTGNDYASVGRQIRDIARSGSARMKGDISTGEDLLTEAIGRKTDIPTANVSGVIDSLIRESGVPSQKALRGENDMLYTLRGQTQTANDLAEQAAVARAEGDAKKAEELSARRDQYINTNRRGEGNIAYDQLRDQRTGIGRRTSLPSIPGGHSKQIYEAITNEMRDVADQRGVSDLWNDVQTREADYYRTHAPMDEVHSVTLDGEDIARRQELDQITNRSTDLENYNWLNSGSAKPHEKYDYLARAAGGAGTPRYRQFMQDNYTSFGNPSPGGTVPENLMDTTKFTTQWRGLDQRTKDLIANGDEDLANRLGNMYTVSKTMKERGKAGNPSGSTIMAIPAKAMSTITNSPAGVIGGAMDVAKPAFIGAMLRDALLNEKYARAMADSSFTPQAFDKGDYFTQGGKLSAILSNAIRGE